MFNHIITFLDSFMVEHVIFNHDLKLYKTTLQLKEVSSTNLG